MSIRISGTRSASTADVTSTERELFDVRTREADQKDCFLRFEDRHRDRVYDQTVAIHSENDGQRDKASFVQSFVENKADLTRRKSFAAALNSQESLRLRAQKRQYDGLVERDKKCRFEYRKRDEWEEKQRGKIRARDRFDMKMRRKGEERSYLVLDLNDAAARQHIEAERARGSTVQEPITRDLIDRTSNAFAEATRNIISTMARMLEALK